jgi:hypothetical protein
LKTPSCPKCSSDNTCDIVYGYPGDEEEYLRLVAEKKIYPGGCRVEDDSPTWYCNNCGNMWRGYSENTDSFDYDQGFNLNEVYDL